MASIKQVRFSVGSDKNKPGMMGVYFDGEYFYSTDGYRITRFKSPEKIEDELLITDALLKKVGNREKPSGFCISQGKIWFFYDNLIAFGKLLEGEFPNCKTLFETVNEMVRNEELRLVKFNRPTLKIALNRLSALRLKPSHRIDAVIRPGVLLLLAGEGEWKTTEKVKCDTDASGFFSVSLNFFKDAISATECFYFNDQKKSPIYFLSQSGLETLLPPLEIVDAEPEATLERVRKLLEEKGGEKVIEVTTAVGIER